MDGRSLSLSGSLNSGTGTPKNNVRIGRGGRKIKMYG